MVQAYVLARARCKHFSAIMHLTIPIGLTASSSAVVLLGRKPPNRVVVTAPFPLGGPGTTIRTEATAGQLSASSDMYSLPRFPNVDATAFSAVNGCGAPSVIPDFVGIGRHSG